jgi:hypothetical protein
MTVAGSAIIYDVAMVWHNAVYERWLKQRDILA